MENFKEKLDEYAKLVVYYGANVQKGKPLKISAPVDQKEFIRSLVKYGYEKGASEVVVDWNDDFVLKEKLIHGDMEVLENVPDFKVDKLEYYYKKDVSVIGITGEDPELLKDVDPKRVKAYSHSNMKATNHLKHYTMNDIVSWTVVALPSEEWAKKVFPNLEVEKAIEKLWEDIFKFNRVGEGKALERWEKHLETLDKRTKLLNEKRFDKLIYKTDKGTNLEVGLPKKHLWASGSSTNSNGVEFVPNMPTEEIFTAPDKNRINGKLIATFPLSYNGVLIKDMEFIFEEGKVVDYSCSEGKEALKSLLETDEGSRYLGEVALVPYDSPISNAKTIYFNTLFDENASCHFAFGQAYPTCLIGGEKLSEDELKESGLNLSMEHADFMVGDPTLEIIGVEEDETEFQIFKNGNFTF